MKKSIYSLLFLGLLALGFQSCDNIPDPVTEKAMVGGLVWTTTPGPKFLAGKDVKLSYTVGKGPAVSSITVKAKFYSIKEATWSNEVVLTDKKAVTGNETADVVVPFTYTFADLSKDVKVKGVQITESGLGIADKWVITVFSNLADGRVIQNSTGNGATIAVANFFAGSYQVTGRFTHPNPASSRDINEKKALDPVDGQTCYTSIGDLGGSNYFMNLSINPTTNAVTVKAVSGASDVFLTADKPSYYDPATKKIYVNYFYVGASGNRVIEEVYTFLE